LGCEIGEKWFYWSLRIFIYIFCDLLVLIFNIFNLWLFLSFILSAIYIWKMRGFIFTESCIIHSKRLFYFSFWILFYILVFRSQVWLVSWMRAVLCLSQIINFFIFYTILDFMTFWDSLMTLIYLRILVRCNICFLRILVS
jgi:hypothetical protein